MERPWMLFCVWWKPAVRSLAWWFSSLLNLYYLRLKWETLRWCCRLGPENLTSSIHSSAVSNTSIKVTSIFRLLASVSHIHERFWKLKVLNLQALLQRGHVWPVIWWSAVPDILAYANHSHLSSNKREMLDSLWPVSACVTNWMLNI